MDVYYLSRDDKYVMLVKKYDNVYSYKVFDADYNDLEEGIVEANNVNEAFTMAMNEVLCVFKAKAETVLNRYFKKKKIAY